MLLYRSEQSLFRDEPTTAWGKYPIYPIGDG